MTPDQTKNPEEQARSKTGKVQKNQKLLKGRSSSLKNHSQNRKDGGRENQTPRISGSRRAISEEAAGNAEARKRIRERLERQRQEKQRAYMRKQQRNRRKKKAERVLKNKKLHRSILFGALAALIIVGGLTLWYVVKAQNFKDKFMNNTYVNGEDVYMKTVDEVETDLKKKAEAYSLTVTFRGGESVTLDAADFGLQYVSDGGVQKAMDAQNIYTWFAHEKKWGEANVIAVSTATTFNQDTLKATVEALPEMQADQDTDPVDAYINLKDTRFEIIAEVEGTQLNEEALLQVLSEAITNLQTSVDLNDHTEVYNQPSVRADNADLNAQMNDLNAFLDTTVTYKLDFNEEVVDRNITSKWIARTDSGYYYVDTTYLRQKVDEFVKQLAAMTDYIRTTKDFSSTNHGSISFNSSEYGTSIDQEKEAELLYTNLIDRTTVTREPVYSRHDTSNTGYGGTYVEVDIESQHVYYYENYELLWDSDCVTGTYLSNMSKEAAQFIYPDLTGIDLNTTLSTPTGVYFIFEKKADYLLHGPEDEDGNYEWETPVSYWMPFNKTVGLHDAPWRTEFGGEIYKESGSHGCVNLPVEKAGELFDLVSVGTIVIVV